MQHAQLKSAVSTARCSCNICQAVYHASSACVRPSQPLLLEKGEEGGVGATVGVLLCSRMPPVSLRTFPTSSPQLCKDPSTELSQEASKKERERHKRMLVWFMECLFQEMACSPCVGPNLQTVVFLFPHCCFPAPMFKNAILNVPKKGSSYLVCMTCNPKKLMLRHMKLKQKTHDNSNKQPHKTVRRRSEMIQYSTQAGFQED